MPRKEKIRVPQTFGELFDHVRNDFAATRKFIDTRIPDNTKMAGKSMQKMLARMFGKKKKINHSKVLIFATEAQRHRVAIALIVLRYLYYIISVPVRQNILTNC